MAPAISQRAPSGKLEAASLSSYDEEISDIASVVRKAEDSWLKNEEVLTILEFFVDRHDQVVFPDVASFQPDGGRLFIFSRKKCRAFRNDRHAWRKKSDNKTIKETHEKLKVADKETLNCYYAHAESGDGLQRRCYWILDKRFDDVVMVHYLCSSTSRVTGGTKSAVPETHSMVRSRPQRAASQRAKFTNLYSSDSEELDRRRGGRESGFGGNRNDTSNDKTDPNDMVGDRGMTDDVDADELGDPLDSFMAKLPEDFGFSKDFILEHLPGDLSISQAQISKMLHTTPSKGPNVPGGVGSTSIGRKDVHGIGDGAMLSPQGERSKGLPSLQLSDADSLLKGFSRLESLEFLKMVSPDFNTSSLNMDALDDVQGIKGESGAEKRAPSSEGNKVSTIRRVVAPSSASTASGFQSLASQGAVAGNASSTQEIRKTLVNPTKTKDVAGKSKTDVAKDKADFNLQRRESLLRKVRNKKDGPAITGSDHHDSGDLMIDAPILFRSSSHLMEKQGRQSPEKAAHLLKQMSIDDAARDATADFLSNTSFDMKSIGGERIEREAFGSMFLDQVDGSARTKKEEP